MCLIIHKKENQQLNQDFFLDVYRRNKDGWGIMWLNRRGQPAIRKGLDYASFAREYDKVRYKEVMIHFRYRTHGEVSLDNAHPYHVLGNVYMMHNGVLQGHNCKLNKHSDTYLFVKEKVRPILEEKGEDYATDPAFAQEISRLCGTNKLGFINKEGFVLIDKERWSKTLSGVTVSNTNFNVDCPNYTYGYGAVKKPTTWKKGDNNYGTTHNIYGEEYSSYDMEYYRAQRKLREERATAGEDKKTTIIGTAPLSRLPVAPHARPPYTSQPLLTHNTSPALTEIFTTEDKDDKILTQEEFREAVEEDEAKKKLISTVTGSEIPTNDNYEDEDWTAIENFNYKDIQEWCSMTPDFMARIIMTMRKKLYEYGYSKKESRVAG